jgi:hypothetical protein
MKTEETLIQSKVMNCIKQNVVALQKTTHGQIYCAADRG